VNHLELNRQKEGGKKGIILLKGRRAFGGLERKKQMEMPVMEKSKAALVVTGGSCGG